MVVKTTSLAVILAPVLVSCAQNYNVRFPDRAFPTRANQRVVIVTSRGRTEVRGVIGSRDIVVRGTVATSADSGAQADARAAAVKITDTTSATPQGPVLRLEVTGIPAGSPTHFDSEFLVPRDLRLEILDGPEDLIVQGMEGSISIRDGAGDIIVQDFAGPVEIEDLDGDILCSHGKGSVKITDRRGNITVEEVAGNVEIMDVEGDALVQSISGNLSFGKRDRGTVRICNIDGLVSFPVWNNASKPIIETIWEPVASPKATAPRGASRAEAGTGPAPAAAREETALPATKDGR
jgi:hypothetical protein